MASLKSRAAPSGQLSTTAIAAIVTGIGVVMLCLLVALIFLLVRAVKKHKQLLADLEERGVSIAQAQKEAGREPITRPRTVLRRNTVLPFHKSGWGALPSVETFRSAESASAPAYYAPPKPTEEVKRASRLSWPFSARRLSGHSSQTIQMKKMRASRLSTVMEDPKNSSLVSILNNTHVNGSRSSIALSGDYGNRPSPCQSLLQYHPAFRNQGHATGPIVPESRSITGSYNHHMDANKRLQRAKSVAEVPSLQPSRPQLRARSVSLCSQTSGNAPDVILPPLPLDIARIKSDAKRRSELGRTPSKLSLSSFGSADTSILTSRSPSVPQSAKFGTRKITKPNAKGSNFARVKPFRDTLDLRARVLGARGSTQSSPTRNSMISEESREVKPENQGTLSTESSTNSLGAIKGAQSVTLSKVSSPAASPITASSLSTPKRKLKTQISSSGSPERHYQSATASRSLNGAIRSPKRQHSQTSSRSSGGNPFQWDPTPISSTGKPSALKGSPSARQGHRRKNSVRISLVPTIHGPPSRTPSLSALVDNKEDTTEGASAKKPKAGIDPALSSTRSLPTPPSSSTFAPDLKFAATSLRASLTPTSPELLLVGYDQSYVVFPTDQVLPALSAQEQKRLSNGSLFSLSQFPTAPSVIEPVDIDMSHPHTFSTYDPYDFDGNWMPDTPLLQQYPFQAQNYGRDRSPSPINIDIDEYNPEQPSCIYQTPANTTSRAFQTAFAPIPEESSVSSNRTLDLAHSRYDDSPPISPKSMSPPRFALVDHSVYNLPTHATVIPEEPFDTIDPAVLSKDSYNMLNSNYNNVGGSIFKTPNSNRSSIAMPTTPGSARSVFDPLLEAALPSTPPPACGMDSPTLAHMRTGSQSSSIYSSPSPTLSLTSWPVDLPSPIIPCSPRPGHAQLPTSRLSINFAEMPRLNPSPRGPRGSPPRPLRSSIAALRRMNSDLTEAEKDKSGRGERRHLRLGRGDSMQLPGDESWLDELEDDDDAVELDDVEGRRLVGNVLEGWEDEGCTVLDLDEGNTSTLSNSTIKPEPKEAKTKPVERNMTATAEHRSSSSIWEDGEKFWASATPPQPPSGSRNSNNLMNHYQPLASSPVLPKTTLTAPTTPTFKSSGKKRDFQVAKDDNPPSPTENSTANSSPSTDHHNKKPRESVDRSSNNSGGGARSSNASSRSHRKRRILGLGTPNVRIQVTSPGGQVRGTPGSLYDSQGFLIF
ncbi:uncharacterized protein K460DRAFT_393240 [Cucurbitaria berberidis CBS 394.84]|uniref:Uncharacterized protein n=1 Tax=Cucurbitaria berberidis CBS 394.84 TaxID=1168544 RepID=A0A9P4GKL8_9PLEO|nr:uncharacterized protein K460DRAFT_393240 [Cucurbitaria berberidis CBS 394.84]KAF1848068.1 hypothetical protein K460DRAFT_393240 [Cucurbitaria berberidis CBS 394.84]